MSEGPIKQWRDGFKSSKPIPASERVHFQSDYPNRAYCGAVSPGRITRDRKLTTCPNCKAAIAADEETRS